MSARIHLSARRQAGFVLVTGLLFLVVLTLLGLAMFRSSGLMDRISGNSRDKQRAFEASQAALQYAEFWLASGNGGKGTVCNGMGLVSGDTQANIHVCSDALASGYQAVVPFTNSFTYTPSSAFATGAAGGMATSGSDVNYSNKPGFYIENLGLAPNGISTVYQVTAYGQGGSADTVSVVRSTYQVTPQVKSLTGL